MLALPVECVVETMRPLPIERAPHGDGDAVVGTARIRGERCAVIDAARLLEIPSDGAARRFLVVRTAERRVALLVDDVLTVRPADGVAVGVPRTDAADALRDVLVRARWTSETAATAGEGVS